jgi:hypothetical protein
MIPESIAAATVPVDSYHYIINKLMQYDEIASLNVFDDSLPTFDGLAVQAKYTILHGKSHSEAELDV